MTGTKLYLEDLEARDFLRSAVLLQRVGHSHRANVDDLAYVACCLLTEIQKSVTVSDERKCLDQAIGVLMTMKS
ncbi:hypothetical protein [Marinomonas shanghaiensis]|uniref:hypothetical protein n=1 Tax=Marinomonas shanghaiensis TaxID=2202418 RepID=UPI000DB9B16A|nr:hypothetical protein [Marinomonas shanghaiensis]